MDAITKFFDTYILLLPLFTTAIGTGALTVGLYSFLNPTSAARIYGISVPISSESSSLGVLIPDLTAFLEPGPLPAKSPPGVSSKPTQGKLQAHTIALLHALAIRNLATGILILTLTSYWHFTLYNATFRERLAVQTVLGLVILTGSLVPAFDALGCLDPKLREVESGDGAYVNEDKGKDKANSKGAGEADDGKLDMGKDNQDGPKSVNIRSPIRSPVFAVHSLRAAFWLWVGLWCIHGKGTRGGWTWG